MIRIALRSPLEEPPANRRRRRFGLDAPLPADPRIVERAVLRHLAERCPAVLVLAVTPVAKEPDEPRSGIDLATGLPDLLLLLPAGRLACLKIKTQAQTLTRAQRAFADLCRERAIPFHIVRSLPEARIVLDHLTIPSREP